jgi:hypothetical protein
MGHLQLQPAVLTYEAIGPKELINRANGGLATIWAFIHDSIPDDEAAKSRMCNSAKSTPHYSRTNISEKCLGCKEL